MLKLEEFVAPYSKTPYSEIKNDFETSEHGYWITPAGDIISLKEAMSHGRVAAGLIPNIFEDYMKTDNGDRGEKSISTNIDIITVLDHKWFRVSITPFIGTINFSWSDTVTPQQLSAMEIIIDTHDPEGDAELWYDGGPGDLRALRAQIRETTGDR